VEEKNQLFIQPEEEETEICHEELPKKSSFRMGEIICYCLKIRDLGNVRKIH